MSSFKTIERMAGRAPIEAALVLGSGLSGIGDALTEKIAIPYSQLEGFPGAGVSGHGRDLLIGLLSGKRVAVLTGREHYYEHGNAAAMRPAFTALNRLGAKTLLLTNSVGSLHPEVTPGHLVMISDHINYAGMNPLIGEATDHRFVNMVDAYDPGLRKKAQEIAGRLGIPLREGVFLWYSGPSFETPAEIRMAIRLGADTVGMSTAPEAILGRFLGMRVWACSSVTNIAAGLVEGEVISHEQTKVAALQGAGHLQKLIQALVKEL